MLAAECGIALNLGKSESGCLVSTNLAMLGVPAQQSGWHSSNAMLYNPIAEAQ